MMLIHRLRPVDFCEISAKLYQQLSDKGDFSWYDIPTNVNFERKENHHDDQHFCK